MGLVALARLFRFVRETQGPNRGVHVGLFQQYTGNKPGDSWCASFVSYLLSIYYQGASPITKSAGCDELLASCRKVGKETSVPMPGDLFFYMRGANDAHHVGIVTATGPLVGIAGNTSEDGKSSNGTGVFENRITAAPPNITFVRLPAPK